MKLVKCFSLYVLPQVLLVVLISLTLAHHAYRVGVGVGQDGTAARMCDYLGYDSYEWIEPGTALCGQESE